MDEGLSGLIQRRQHGFHFLMYLLNVEEIHTRGEIFLDIPLLLIIQQLRHLGEAVIDDLLLSLHLLLKLTALFGQITNGALDGFLTAFSRHCRFQIQKVVGMDADATFPRRNGNRGEGILRIAAVQHDVTGLGNDLGGLADHVLHPVDSRVDGNLTDTGGTADDMSRLADAIQGHFTALDDHASLCTAMQHAALIDIADHDLRG